MGKAYFDGLMKVLVFENKQWIELTCKESIENVIHQSNIRKFTQTNNSPAMMPPLVDDLGFLGNTPQCNLIL